MNNHILKVEVEHKASNTAINAVVINGKLILSSLDEGVILAAVDNATHNLNEALPSALIETHKYIDDLDELNQFEFEEMIKGAIEYAEDCAEYDKALPVEYEYQSIVFTGDELLMMLTHEKREQLHAQIDAFIEQNS